MPGKVLYLNARSDIADRGKTRGSRFGTVPSGHCVCPDCGTKAHLQRGKACHSATCPYCGTKMVRR